MTKRLTVSPPEPGPDELWTIEETAAFLRVPPLTLYTWRKRHYGPPAGRVGRHLRYDAAAVRAWYREQVVA
ncbi:helix-turn-helix domain-containing protein [Actinoplanes sp. NPDC051859]|uniref:helix-turn-helix domain-containing protein n=1 Tax=Actinoplanes sp. NPDC051859 TaxID=3363909 RepID=UPI0037A41A75